MIVTRTGAVYDPNIAQCDAALADMVRAGWRAYRVTVDHILEVRFEITTERAIRHAEDQCATP